MVSLRDLAKKNKVSLATVSRALRNDPSVKPKTRDRILRSAAELDYNPNNLVEGIIKGRTKLVAWISNNIGQGISGLSVSPMIDELTKKGWGLIALNSHGDLAQEAACFQIAVGMRVSGIVLATVSYQPEAQHYRLLSKHAIPYVVVNEYMPGQVVPHIHGDDINTASQLIKHLVELGHRRIAHLAGPAETFGFSLRLTGYRQTMADAGIDINPEWVMPTDWTIADSRGKAHELLRKHPDVTAIFAGTDIIAAGVYLAAHDLGRRIPDDLSVVTMGSSMLVQALSPEVTHIHQSYDQIGRKAVDILMELINMPKGDPLPRRLLETVVPGKLILGKSTTKIRGT